MRKIDTLKVPMSASIRTALKKMDKGGIGFIGCVDKAQNVIGIATDGDFRRAILNGISLDENIIKIINKKFISISPGYNRSDVRDIFSTTAIRHLPVLDHGKMIDLIIKEEYFGVKKELEYPTLDLPVVIMAGGKGTRLDPFTRILPKPLIPVGNKAVLELILDNFSEYSIKDFYLIINYKGEMIKSYFDNIQHNYNLHYIWERKPLGTSGGLKLLPDDIGENFFVSNCDIIIKKGYAKIYKFHQDNKNDITVVAAMQDFKIPYGIIEIENGGKLKSIKEKPEYNFLVNIGMYILNKKVLREIPDNQPYDMTDLIRKVKEDGGKISVYPISQDSWQDIGQWEKYKESIKIMEENNN